MEIKTRELRVTARLAGALLILLGAASIFSVQTYHFLFSHFGVVIYIFPFIAIALGIFYLYAAYKLNSEENENSKYNLKTFLLLLFFPALLIFVYLVAFYFPITSFSNSLVQFQITNSSICYITNYTGFQHSLICQAHPSGLITISNLTN
jgi:heme/copper-type cytochrome/quinol oxidase subunit 2